MGDSPPPSAIIRVKNGPNRTPAVSPAPVVSADYNLRILWPLARYVEDRRGARELEQVAIAGSVASADFQGGNVWVNAGAFEAILARARSFLDDDEEFGRACVYRLREAYGPLRYVLWALSPAAVFAQAAKQYPLVCSCGELTVTEGRVNSAHVTVSSRVPMSRLCCLLRQAQSVALPTMWGLAPAHVREDKCIARGDATCELQYHWYAGRRWLPPFLGAAAAALIGHLLVRLGLAALPTPLALAWLGGLVGYLLETRRSERVNEQTRREVMEALQQLAQEGSEARRDLLDMHQRQEGWTRLVEEEMNTRSSALQNLVAGVKDLNDARATTVLGFSHDLRNPLQIIQMSAEYLGAFPALRDDGEASESVRDIRQAVERMRHMLGEMVTVTKGGHDFVRMAPRRVETADLTQALARRLRALAYGRDVRTTVFATREAPAFLEVDPVALDRIVDNLLTNAAKYTERGSIVAELEGTPGYLVIKVSDTGRGIEAADVDRIFQPGGSSPESRRGDSFGVGLSVVVQLLGQMGGRMEIMSRPGLGTTFWVYLPLTPPQERVSGSQALSNVESAKVPLSELVRVRKLQA